MIQLRFFNRNLVVLNDYDSIHTALVTKGKDFAGRPFGYGKRAAYVWEYETSILINNPSPQWKALRSTMHSKVKMYAAGLNQVEEANMSVIGELMQDFRNKEGHAFNPKDSIYNAIMNIICTFLVGRKYSLDDETFKLFKKVEQMTVTLTGPGAEGAELDVMWFLRFFGHKTFKKLTELRDLRRQLWSMVKEDLEARREGGNYDNGIIGTLLETYKENNDKNIKDINVMLCFQDLILAGTATTAHSTHAFINIMINYPKVLKKLQAEVDDVIGNHRPVTMQDKNQMPFARAVILELLRYTSILSLGVTHAALVDSEINRHFIPKGTPVITNLWALHHDESFWKDPYVFRPERFLDTDNQLLPADHPYRKHLMPFGGGIRVCLGESLALGRLFLLFTTLAQMFDIEEGTTKVSADSRDFLRGSILASPDYDVRLLPRNQNLFN